MESLYQILGIIGAGLIIWLLYHSIKNRPELFSRENLGKSFSTMGMLALFLIAFIAFLVYMLK